MTPEKNQRWAKTILDNIPDLAWLKDREGRYLAVNQPFAEYFGKGQEDLVGKTDSDIWPPELARRLSESDRIVASAGRRLSIEEHFEDASGKKSWLETIKTPAYSEAGELIGTVGVARDITWRKREEEALFDSQQMLRLVLDTIPLRVFWKDRDSNYLGCNKIKARDCGYDDPSELVGKTDYETASAATAELYRSDDRTIMENDRPKLGYEEPQIRADGSRCWLRTYKVPMHDQNGRVIGVLGMYEDITERKRVEEALRESQKRYRTIVETTGEGIWIIDRDARTKFVNPQMAAMLGYAAEEMLDKQVFELLDEENSARFKELMEQRRRGVGGQYDLRLRRKNGEELWGIFNAKPIFDEQGGVIGSFAMVTDITERKRGEILLAGQRHVLEILARGAPLPTVLDALVRAVEPQANGMLCSVLLLDEEVKHVRYGAAPSLPDSYNKAIDGAEIGPRAGSCGTAAFFNKTVIVSDTYQDPLWESYRDLAKKHRLRACWSTPVVSSGGKVLGTFAMYYHEVRSPTDFEVQLIRDSTKLAAIAIEHARTEADRNRLLAQEREARIEAERSTQMRDDFLAIASHELRTPITPLKMQLQLFKRNLRDLPTPLFPKQSLLMAALEGSDRELNRLLKLIEDLLDASRIAAGRFVMSPKEVDLSQSLRETVDRLGGGSTKINGCELNLEIEGGIRVLLDQFRFEQVVANLLSNATKYGAGKPIDIRLSADAAHAILMVRDHGIGIPKEEQPKLFQRFERLAPIKHFAGLGMGLYIVRQIVEASGGSIRVESERGRGSTFTVVLPLRARAKAAQAA